MMTQTEFCRKIKHLLNETLPKGSDVIASGRALACGVTIGKTEFLKKHGVSSELEYKRRCIAERRITYHAHIGLNTWSETVDGLRDLYAYSAGKDFTLDRFGVALDRRMGLPEKMRASAPKETGPMISTTDEWMQLGNTVPVQPHMGDFIIGFPASVENTLNSLSAGVTTIGNLSQFFCHEAPTWNDPVFTLQETVKALSIMGSLREQGTLVHSYLDDGMGALFLDYTTVAGWAYMEKYIVEDLLGGKLGHCVGGLITDPLKRMAWVFALDIIHNHDCVGTMFYGDTLSFSLNFDTNTALVGEYLLWDILAQLECPTGHAVHPVPVTEAMRVPTVDEICRIQDFGHAVEKTARCMLPYFNFSPARDMGKLIADKGREVFNNAMKSLNEAGVDVKDPVRMLYLLKNMGAPLFEEMFGVGGENATFPRGRIPIVPTDIFEQSNVQLERHYTAFKQDGDIYSGRRILMASGDVHIHALYIIERLLSRCGAGVINIGAEKNPSDIAKEALLSNASVVMISIHNGQALEYAHSLFEEINELGMSLEIIMGGVLNQKTDKVSYPIDVSEDLEKLGIRTSFCIEDLRTIFKVIPK